MKPIILCVDDERIILSGLKVQLYAEFGDEYHIELAESGEEALEIVSECMNSDREIPLVITDQIMGGIRGDELLSEIKTRLPDTLSIMLTGQASVDSVGQALNKAGLFRYISKPWNLDDFLLTVRTALHSYKEHQLLARQHRFIETINQTLLNVLAVESINEQLTEVLATILALKEFSISGKAVIFLAEAGEVTLTVEQGVSGSELHADALSEPNQLIELICEEESGESYFRMPIFLDGELSGLFHLYVPSDSELSSELDSFFNTLIHILACLIRLHRYHDDLEQHRQHLSSLVKERTRALIQTLEEQENNNKLLTKANQELQILATTDDLTGLMNRRAFFTQADLELARAQRYKRQTAIAILDLDYFKSINDRYGHDVGDQLLVKIGSVLSNAVRESDLVARVGGEEFAMVMPETSMTQARDLCERLRSDISKCSVDIEGEIISISVSIGVTSLKADEVSISAAMSRADKALYESKNKGRNLVTEN